MPATFDDETFTYSISGQEVDDLAVKGASDTIARDAQARLSVIASRLENGTISLQEGYDSAKREIKYLHMAETALARGGFDQVRDWSGAEKTIAEQWGGNEQFPGLRKLFEDIDNGRYGIDQLGRPRYGGGPSFQNRLLSYGDAGRLTYENERLAARMEEGLWEAKRVVGGADHCKDCPAWAALGWIEAHRMLNNYPIGASECNVNCFCIIVMRRAATDTAIGWNAMPSVMERSLQTGTSLAAAAAVLFGIARTSPTLMQFVLQLLARALGATQVGL